MPGNSRSIGEVARDWLGATTDVLNRGMVAGVLGAPVDIAAMVMRPFGYNVETPVGGSEWIGKQMQRARVVSGTRRPIAEFAASLIDPATAPAAVAKGAALGAAKIGMLPLAIGQIAWHGSPHKFDKFDLSKIGTGEGAQAYGHGLYLAESPEVAKAYQDVLGGTEKQYFLGGKQVDPRMMNAFESNALDHLAYGKTPEQAIADLESDGVGASALAKMKSILDDFNKLGVKRVDVPKANSSLYKTDIPDEAVARFLDWDKPLSEQAPEVRKAMREAFDALYGGEKYGEKNFNQAQEMTGGDLVNFFRNREAAAQAMNEAGIPGIRYLDQGSRGAGAGTSNFVVFDPEMIRILERNGKPTGLQPWAPGEWQGLLETAAKPESPVRLISSQRFLDQDIVNDKIRKKDFSVKVSPVFELPDTGEKVRVVQDGHHALAAALESGNKPNILEQNVTQNDRIGLLNQGQIDDFLNASYHDSPWYYLDNGVDIW